MAILFVWNVAVARKSEIDAKHPGGLARFWDDRSKRGGIGCCEDEHLVCFTDMGGADWPLISHLLNHGVDVLVSNENERPEDVLARCSWIECDFYELFTPHRYSRPPANYNLQTYLVRYWLKGTNPGEASCPVTLSAHSGERLLRLERRFGAGPWDTPIGITKIGASGCSERPVSAEPHA